MIQDIYLENGPSHTVNRQKVVQSSSENMIQVLRGDAAMSTERECQTQKWELNSEFRCDASILVIVANSYNASGSLPHLSRNYSCFDNM